MGDGSSRSILKSLRNEWSLFLEAFHGEEETSKNEHLDFEHDEEAALDIDKIRQVTRVLLEDRRRLNQRMESLTKEIDLNSAKLESLRLVGAEDDTTLSRIHELHDLGQGISTAMSKLDVKLREIREQENQFNEEMMS